MLHPGLEDQLLLYGAVIKTNPAACPLGVVEDTGLLESLSRILMDDLNPLLREEG